MPLVSRAERRPPRGGSSQGNDCPGKKTSPRSWIIARMKTTRTPQWEAKAPIWPPHTSPTTAALVIGLDNDDEDEASLTRRWIRMMSYLALRDKKERREPSNRTMKGMLLSVIQLVLFRAPCSKTHLRVGVLAFQDRCHGAHEKEGLPDAWYRRWLTGEKSSL